MIVTHTTDKKRVVAREIIDSERERIDAFLLSFGVNPLDLVLLEGDWIVVDLATHDSDEPTDISLVSALDFLDDYTENWSG